MRIVTLIENTEGAAGCTAAHGLSFYVETPGHRLLSDLGPSGQTLRNAERLGVDLRGVDTVVLSHGHYDHSGGILAFAARNPAAPIYLQRTAPGPYYADDGSGAEGPRWRYIGIDPGITALPQLRFVDGDRVLDEALSLFVVDTPTERFPFSNARLKEKTAAGWAQDRFRHEQFLVIREGALRILISGCAHNGILNILREFRRKYGGAPDAVLSGFHLMQKTEYSTAQLEEIRALAARLAEYDTVFYTCHCTGLPAFGIMKEILGERLRYLHTGDELRLSPPERT